VAPAERIPQRRPEPAVTTAATAPPTNEGTPAAAGEPPSQAPTSGKPKAIGALDVTDIRRQWDLVLSHVQRVNKRVSAFVREAVVREIEGDTLVLVFQHQFHAQSLSSDPKVVVDALTEVFGGSWQVRCELAGQQSGPPTSAPVERRSASQPPAADAEAWPETAPIRRDEPDDLPEDDGWPAAVRPPATPAAAAPASSGATPSAGGQTATRGRASSRAAAPKAATSGSQERGSRPSKASPPTRTAPPPEMGFDDGDEPLDDDDDGAAVRQSSEEQAIDLLRQTLGAEKIGDLDTR
jgi:DNA polymerase-3 subunit gamma/tau